MVVDSYGGGLERSIIRQKQCTNIMNAVLLFFYYVHKKYK